MSKVCCEKTAFVCVTRNGPYRWGFMLQWTCAQSHTNSQDHDVAPSIRPKTQQITSIPYTSGSVSQLFVSSFACLWLRSVEALLVNMEMGRGSSWSSLDLEDSAERRVVGQVGRCPPRTVDGGVGESSWTRCASPSRRNVGELQ